MEFESSRFFWILWIAVAASFFVGTLMLSVASSSDIYVSPDETASAFFAQHFSQTGNLFVFDPFNQEFSDSLYPRSIVAKNALLLPGSFLGLPVLYGSMMAIFGDWILLLLTPLVAVFASLAFRRVLSVYFSKRISDISSVLFLIHPAIWYYSARGLMPNVLFTSFVVFAVYFFFVKPVMRSIFISGLLIGFALFVRASEIYWIAASIILIFIFTRNRPSRKEIIHFFIGFLIGLLPFFYFNQITYGNPFTIGYTVSEVVTGQETTALSNSTILPFGFDASAIVENISNYGALIFWWLSVFTLIGIPIVFARNHFYVFLFFCISIWLGIWYGSWTLFDNPDFTQVTIANSYVRYWIPVFVLSIPFVSEAIVWISNRGRTNFARRLFLCSIVVLVAGLNVRLVFFEGQDALINVAENLRESRAVKKEVLSTAPENSVIVVDRADKLFFPDRHVRYPFRSEKTYNLMPKIASTKPLFYYGITFPQSDLDYLNQTKLKNLGLQIESIKTFNKETFYKIFIQ